MHDFWGGKHGDLLSMLSQKTTENFLYGMYFFHIIIITTTLEQWTRYFFPLSWNYKKTPLKKNYPPGLNQVSSSPSFPT